MEQRRRPRPGEPSVSDDWDGAGVSVGAAASLVSPPATTPPSGARTAGSAVVASHGAGVVTNRHRGRHRAPAPPPGAGAATTTTRTYATPAAAADSRAAAPAAGAGGVTTATHFIPTPNARVNTRTYTIPAPPPASSAAGGTAAVAAPAPSANPTKHPNGYPARCPVGHYYPAPPPDALVTTRTYTIPASVARSGTLGAADPSDAAPVTTRTYTVPAAVAGTAGGGGGGGGRGGGAHGPVPPPGAHVTTRTYTISADGGGGADPEGESGGRGGVIGTGVPPPNADTVNVDSRARAIPVGGGGVGGLGGVQGGRTVPPAPTLDDIVGTEMMPQEDIVEGKKEKGGSTSARATVVKKASAPTATASGGGPPEEGCRTEAAVAALGAGEAGGGGFPVPEPPEVRERHWWEQPQPLSPTQGYPEHFSSVTAVSPPPLPPLPRAETEAPKEVEEATPASLRPSTSSPPPPNGALLSHPPGSGAPPPPNEELPARGYAAPATGPSSSPASSPPPPSSSSSGGFLPFSGLHSGNPARLTMYPPNDLAHSLFLDTRKRVQAGLTKGQKAQKLCWISICGTIMGFGLFGCIFLLAKGDGAIVPFLFMLLVLMPALVCVLWLYEKWQHLAPEKILDVLGEILDGRARDVLLGRGGGGALAALEPPVGDGRGRLAVDLFPDGGVGPFRALQRGGYASLPSWATYHAGWRVVLSRIGAGGDGAVAEDLHARWLDTVSKMAIAADGFTQKMDVQKAKAWKRVARQGLDFAGDTLSDLADIGGLFGDLKDIKGSLEDIRDNLRDAREAYKAQGIDADWGEDDGMSESGLHPIQRRRLGFMIPFMCLCFFLPALSFGLLGVPAGAWAMAGIGLFMVVAAAFFSTRLNSSLQLMECIVELEERQRALLKTFLGRHAGTDGDDEDGVVKATDALRDVLMENYYAALAIHIQSEALTYRPFPYPGNPPMLVPRPEDEEEGGGGDGNGSGSGSGGEAEVPSGTGEEVEVSLEGSVPTLHPPNQDPDVAVSYGGTARHEEPSRTAAEAGTGASAGFTPTNEADHGDGRHGRDASRMEEGKTVEMITKADGTQIVTTTTTTRNSDGTVTTIKETSTHKDSNIQVEDFFHDDDTRTYAM